MKYFMFNKPAGCVTARKDKNYMTVMDYFPYYMHENFHPVGRLDKNTHGMLLITDNGKFTHYLMQPENHVPKKYFFYCFGELNNNKKKQLETGIYFKGINTVTKPAKLEILNKYTVRDIENFLDSDKRESYIKNPAGIVTSGILKITEGKRHQVKRMLAAVNCHVAYLKRIAIGNVQLDDNLKEGCYRELTSDELKLLYFNQFS